MDKAPGRGKGKFGVAGHEEDQEARISALEDYLADQIESGVLPPPAPPVEEPEEEEAPPA